MVVLDYTKLRVFNLLRKKAELACRHTIRAHICDFIFYGKHEDGLMILTVDGYIHILRYGGLKLIKTHRVETLMRMVECFKLSVSSDNRFLCVFYTGTSHWVSMHDKSRFKIFEVVENELKDRALCEFKRSQGINGFTDMCFYGQYGSSYLFAGFTNDFGHDVYLGLYDSQENSVRELKQKRCLTQKAHPIALGKADSRIFMVGRRLKLSSFKLLNLPDSNQ